ncbi:DNA polymerase epsilon catalytic subunit A [Trichogramma pretiosum]|uniref:DNA polymerase epsilon catalytic subunit A n=1 Tax=Trichogramma pretiosum TaxID=7493 RepID=UPI0006C9D8C1|nr:DNA polymerase epsilon catalytic subunit A [Trichogramma pretiosum]
MPVNTGKYTKDRGSKDYNYQDGGIPRENTPEGRLYQVKENNHSEGLYGFHRVTDVKDRVGFLINMHTTEIVEDDKQLFSGVDLFFLEDDGSRFKISLPYNPYFYVLCRDGTNQEVITYMQKKFSGFLLKIEIVSKEDLDLPNHLAGLTRDYLKLSFTNIVNLQKVKRDIMSAVKVNKEREKSNTHYAKLLAETFQNQEHYQRKIIDQMDNVIDIREHDVPHHVRVSIDLEIFVGKWYNVRTLGATAPPIISAKADLVEPPEPVVLAYDIETTKLPLKFPDAAIDQIMMISYMLDGQGYLINNREIISADVDDFEYTPKPEYEGRFTVWNEPNEKAVINKFFNHINEVKPHIFVTYNGDFFDWPFVEARAAIHDINMKERIGFAKNKDGVYTSRAAMHLDCLCWVKRDSYLPVGSQGLKAVSKAKLRYDPVEIDPEDMCRLAAEDPETMCNYSVSDAVATFYLYHKYVHPFIFALCTIIPMEPEEVLRKGSGTLCESLLMVEAKRVNVIYPNKQEAEWTKFTRDGHLLDVETYVGGHVEALESGVFRADIPYKFKIVPSAVDELMEGVENALRHAIEEEEKVPMSEVTNFDEVVQEVKEKLAALRAQPLRTEKPIIYHLDVGAMYPNIILTNRLQPYAMVDESACAACDYNKPGAQCQRNMEWMWRGEYLKATAGEYQRTQQQLETEKFPPLLPGGRQRAFHELSKQEQAAIEKKRLSDYCKRTYKKVKETKTEERTQTVCQRENSFYVDTVRAFRDRRYEYKGLTKRAKAQLDQAKANKDAAAVKSANSRVVLYDSLQLAHKCILNSFYGYVMRKGSRWFSMEMGGIVCYTGAHIIMKAREIVEQVGRPLELDTDGIWCILPGSFPDNFIVKTTNPKKSKLVVSYPNAMLNFMVKDQFTNDQYHELVDPANRGYKIRSENSIFFEVDGPYLAMVLPAAKEEGRKLKKRYAVFNFDGSLAELKGFEVKRRGELRLIKLFQSNVFESFLKGGTLEECYAEVAKVANYWLDILFQKGAHVTDTELFDLISENKSMSKKLDEYGAQKSTSISTAKRLAEFLGDEMVKDAGLACKYIISRKPLGAPVTERAVPLAIFQSEPSVTRHYLRRWLKDPSIQEIEIRDILDWQYYIERLGSTIQKIITIPAALQGISNPVPRVPHPDWLHKKMLEKTDGRKQRKITDVFQRIEKPVNEDEEEGEEDDDSDAEAERSIMDMEDIGAAPGSASQRPFGYTVTKRKRTFSDEEHEAAEKEHESLMKDNWRKVLGNPPANPTTHEEFEAWLKFHKEKWAYQAKQRAAKKKFGAPKRSRMDMGFAVPSSSKPASKNQGLLGGFLQRAQQKLLETPWQIIQMIETSEPGLFRVWILVDQELQLIKLNVPRIFYVNTRLERQEAGDDEKRAWKKCHRILPRSRPVYHLYRYSLPERSFKTHSGALMNDIIEPDIEGIYETQMSLEFRAIMNLGCVCAVDRAAMPKLKDTDTFDLEQLNFRTFSTQPYLKQIGEMKKIFLYHHWSVSSNFKRGMWSLFLPEKKICQIFALDTVRTDRMPNMNTLYTNERNKAIEMEELEFVDKTPETLQFEVKFETDVKAIYTRIQNSLKNYKKEVSGATILVAQTPMPLTMLTSKMPYLNEFPVVKNHIQDLDDLYDTLDWQRAGSKMMLRHYFKNEMVLRTLIEQARYFYAPVGNLPTDVIMFGADLFYARHLQKANFVLWWSATEKPDFGGSENDDSRLLTDIEEKSGCTKTHPGVYINVCFELDLISLAVTALVQSHHINDIEGTSSYVAFHNAQQASLQDIVSGDAALINGIPSYDEAALCNPAFKVMKHMVATWLKEVSQFKNPFADYLLMHFYRWLRSPTSFLYDPALRRTLHNYTKKLFVQLVSELQRMGSTIIHADFTKIILCTQKKVTSDAQGYTQFIIQSILNKELFHSIHFEVRRCWEFLVWLDASNFAGIRKNKRLEETDVNMTPPEESEVAQSQSGSEEVELVMNWNMIEYVPIEMCQLTFTKTISTYYGTLYENLLTSKPEDVVKTVKDLISGEMSQKLFHYIQAIHKKHPEKELTLEEYPHLDFDHKSKKMTINPALELSKAICKVLSLDPRIEEEVSNLHKNLLRLIDVGAFSDKAEWKDPCVSFTLPEVLCENCNHVRNIDLCKDSYQHIEDNKQMWKCPNCHLSYDNDQIEFNLIDSLNRQSVGYMIQDVQCLTCNEVKQDNIAERCSCSGYFKTMLSRDNFIRTLKILRLISTRCQMPLLGESLDFMLTNIE